MGRRNIARVEQFSLRHRRIHAQKGIQREQLRIVYALVRQSILISIHSKIELVPTAKRSQADGLQILAGQIQEGPVLPVGSLTGTLDTIHPAVFQARIVHQHHVALRKPRSHECILERSRRVLATLKSERCRRLAEGGDQHAPYVRQSLRPDVLRIGGGAHLQAIGAQQFAKFAKQWCRILRSGRLRHGGRRHNSVFINKIGRLHKVPSIPGRTAEKSLIIAAVQGLVAMLPHPDKEKVRLLQHIPEVGIDGREFEVSPQHVCSGEVPAAPGFRLVLNGGRLQEDIKTGGVRCRPRSRHYRRNSACTQIRDRFAHPHISWKFGR